MGLFVDRIQDIKKRASQDLEKGAVTPGYRANKQEVIRILNEALATEIVCVLRYKSHSQRAEGIHSEGVIAEFLEHAKEEQEHADWIANRISQLGGEPNYNPASLAERSHTDYGTAETLYEMIKEDLIAERIAVEIYGDCIRYLGNEDPTTRRGLERILEQEEEHADDMAKLLRRIDSSSTSGVNRFAAL